MGGCGGTSAFRSGVATRERADAEEPMQDDIHRAAYSDICHKTPALSSPTIPHSSSIALVNREVVHENPARSRELARASVLQCCWFSVVVATLKAGVPQRRRLLATTRSCGTYANFAAESRAPVAPRRVARAAGVVDMLALGSFKLNPTLKWSLAGMRQCETKTREALLRIGWPTWFGIFASCANYWHGPC